MRLYLKFLSICYAAGAILHMLDIFDLRNEFSQMNSIWKLWILFLLLFDSVAAPGLWFGKTWGVLIFLMIAILQLIAYVGFRSIFGQQTFLVVFHIVTVAGYLIVLYRGRKTEMPLHH